MRYMYFHLMLILLSWTSFNSCGGTSKQSSSFSAKERIEIIHLDSFTSSSSKIGSELVISNTIDLKGRNAILPSNSILVFKKGGAIINGTLVGNATQIKSKYNDILGVKLRGTWLVEEISDLTFCKKYLTDNEIINNINVIQSDLVSNVLTINRDYVISIPWSGGYGLLLSSNSELNLYGTISIAPNDYISYSIISIKDKNNVRIKGGTIIGDVGKHKYIEGSTSEWGKGINVMESSNVMIEDMRITLCTGDGIYITGNFESQIGVYDHSSKNVTIRRVVCDDNRRQGMSVIHVDGLIVRDCSFINTGRTQSTAPSAGIDIEPNVTNNRNMSVRNVLIDNCIVKNNKGMAIANSTTYIKDGKKTHENILYSNCETDGLLKCSADGVTFRKCSFKEVRLASVYTPTNICFEACSISGGYGLILYTSPSVKEETKDKLLTVSFKNCYLSTDEGKTETSSLINCKKASIPNLQSVSFENCRIEIPREKDDGYKLVNANMSDKIRVKESEIIMPGRDFDPKGLLLDSSIIRCRKAPNETKQSAKIIITK